MNRPPVVARIVALDDAKWDLKGIQDDLANLPDISVIAVTHDASFFMRVIEEEQPDVVITDLRLHDDYDAGFRILSEVKTRFPAIRCLVLTVYPALGRFVEALDCGADAFISKQAVHEGRYRLADVIRSIMRGAKEYEGELVLEMRQRLDLSPNPISGPDVRTDVVLSQRQREIIKMISEGRTNGEIAHALSLSGHTVKAHIDRILVKLKAEDRHHASRIARLNGLL